jgi:hypothetical protein
MEEAKKSPPQGGSAMLPPPKPAFAKPTTEQLEHRYMYHAPKGDQAQRYEQVRAACCSLAITLVRLTPCSPEQARALNALDEVMMLASAAIARNE